MYCILMHFSFERSNDTLCVNYQLILTKFVVEKGLNRASFSHCLTSKGIIAQNVLPLHRSGKEAAKVNFRIN